MRGGENEELLFNGYAVSFQSDENVLGGEREGWWLYNTVNVPDANGLFTFKYLILFRMNFT